MRGGNKLTEWSDLSENQKTAVRYRDGPLLIIAGPGSGKTEVLACRVAYLIKAGIAKPDNIMVATFTDKAAVELKDRIQEKNPYINIEMAQVSTIHSFCLKLLYKYHYHIDMPADFKILGELEQLLFILSHHEELGFVDILGDDPYDFLAEVKRIFNLATEELVKPSDLEDWCWINLENCGENSEKWREWSLIASAYDRYLGLLHDEGVLDFASIQSCALRLLEDYPQALAEIRNRYQDVFIDEYQDTNAVQDKIIDLLAGDGKRLTAVGDDDQSIYRFRGATVRNILTFQGRFPNAAVIKLEQNFRSKKAIVHNGSTSHNT